MKLKLDENLGERASAFLREAGHDVVTVWEQGLTGADDLSVIQAAAKNTAVPIAWRLAARRDPGRHRVGLRQEGTGPGGTPRAGAG